MSSMYPPFGGSPAQRCLRCGTPLPPNVVTCVNCGTYNPVAQPGASPDQGQVQWRGSQPQAPFGGGQYSGSQWGQIPVLPPQNNQWGQPSVLPQNNTFGTSNTPQPSSLPNNFLTMPGQNQQTNSNNYYATPQQNAFYSAPTTTYEGSTPANLNDSALVGYDHPPQQKRGPKVGLIVGIVLLLILLVGGAFAGYLYYNNQHQNSTATNATPTTLSTPTLTPFFSDSFANNNMGWDLTSYTGKFSVKVGGGSLVLEDDQNKLLWEILPGKSFTDFRLDVNATLTKGDPNNGYGVFIRASSQGNDLGTYYRFELYGDGTYAIFKGYLDANGKTQSTKVQGYTTHAAIAKVGQVNHITIIAKGPAMTMMVNGQSVYTYTDGTYKSGSLALFVSNLPTLTPGAQAIFTNLKVFPMPE
jgi:hypothetical protein